MIIELTAKEMELLKAMCFNVVRNGNTSNPKPLEVNRDVYVTACNLYKKANASK